MTCLTLQTTANACITNWCLTMFLNPVITSCSKHLECYRDNFADKRYLRLNVRLKIWFIILVKSNLQNQINSITISNTLYIDLDWIRLQTCSISLDVRVISNSPFEKPRISGVRFSHFPQAWNVDCKVCKFQEKTV